VENKVRNVATKVKLPTSESSVQMVSGVRKTNRLFLKIPLVLEAAADGPIAVLALTVVAIAIVATKALQLW
jgi:hypothetical protein